MVSVEYMYDILFNIHWPIYITMYIFLAGMSAGVFIVSTLGHLLHVKGFRHMSRVGMIIALIIVLLALLFLIVDLSQPTKASNTMIFFNPGSVMSWGVFLLMVYPVVAVIHVWFTFRADFARLVKKNSRRFVLKAIFSLLILGQRDLSPKAQLRDGRYARIFGIASLPLELMVASYTGFILSVISGNALWNTVLVPLHFLTSAIASGIAILMIAYAVHARYFSTARKADPRPMRTMSVVMVWTLVVDAVLLLCMMIRFSNAGYDARDALWLLTQGPLAFNFIAVKIILGTAIPVAIIALPATARRTGYQVVAAAMVVSGILAMRFNIIIGGQYLPVAGGELATYNLTVEELLKVLGIVSVGLVLAYVAFKLLPIEPIRKARPGAVPDATLPAGKPAPLRDTGMDRRTFVNGALAVSGVLMGVYLGLVGLGRVGSPTGAALASDSAAGGKPVRYAMVIDLSRCIGCHSCTQACKGFYDLPAGVWRSWVTKKRKSDGVNQKSLFLPRLCNHCDNPPCVKACPVGATYKDKDGMVLQRFDRCIGCKYCIMACPYGMRFVHPVLKVVDKCSLCNKRVKNGLLPVCVTACPAGARIFGDLEDNTSELSRLVATKPTKVLKPELGTKPMVYYIGGDTELMETGVRHE